MGWYRVLMRLLFLLGLLACGVWLQIVPATESRSNVECVGSLVRVKLDRDYFQDKYVSFAAIDKFGRSRPLDDARHASQCGYTIHRDVFGNLELRASLISCYAQTVDDRYFTMIIQILAATNPEMRDAAPFVVPVSCPYGPWKPREIVCEANYMEVSVRRNVPQIQDDFLQDQPEDWEAAFPEAKAGAPSIWQIVFHMGTWKKVMLVEEAHRAGYGVNTTETRILLRASYNATEAQQIMISGVSFSAVRSSTFFKQRWMLLMVDTAVACPIDGVTHTKDTITWTIPKGISPLLAGAGTIKELQVEMGVNLCKFSAQDIASRGYQLISEKDAIVMKIPIGAPEGRYKSYVSAAGKLLVSYKINPFIEHLWEDETRGITKHTILKEIETPLQNVSIVVTDHTNVTLQIFNATIGPFLPDVELVNVTVNGSRPWTLPEAEIQGYIYEVKQPNGSKDYVLKVPFSTPGIEKVYVTDDIRNYTVNVICGFIVIPKGETFDFPFILVVLVEDAVLPQAVGSCDDQALYLVVEYGNVDQDWLPFVGDTFLSQEMAMQLGYSLQENRTHLSLRVPRPAAHVLYEEISSSGALATFQLQLKDRLTLAKMIDFGISCSFSPKDLIDCLPNGTVVISATKLVGIPDMEPSHLVLRDRLCRPTSVTEDGATFIFNVSACGTTRKFENATVTYENEVLYFPPGKEIPVYRLKCACQYSIGDSLLLQYSPLEAPSPSILPGIGMLSLALKLARDKSYSDFYQDTEYPVTSYLRDPLYFQVELLNSKDPALELFLEDCWATMSPDRTSSPQWNIVIDSCENTQDSHQTTFHRVPSNSVPFPTHLKRFEVKMFTFVVNGEALQGQIYVHCSTIICDSRQPSSDALCARPCIPRRQRLGRSVDSTNDIHGYVSSGAVVIGNKSL